MKQNSNTKKRYQDTWHWQKAITICVSCPKCQKMAIVDNSNYFNSLDYYSEVRCHHCGFQKNSLEITYYVIKGQFRCPECTTRIPYFQDNLKQKPESLQIKCDYCHYEIIITPKYEKHYKEFPNPNGLACDFMFGLPFYYQTNIRGNLFWAYNQAHAQEMLDYVSADLRERFGMTMVAKLPTFIKSAKNRDLVIKVLEKWLSVEN